MSEVIETEVQEFDLEEISGAERIRAEIEEAAAIRRNLISNCERLLQIPLFLTEAEEAVLTEPQQAAIANYRASNHLSARITAIGKIDDVAERALTMMVDEFKFCLNGALDCFTKTYMPEAELVRQFATAFDDEIPELADGLADIWKSHGASEMRETMRRGVYVKVGL